MKAIKFTQNQNRLKIFTIVFTLLVVSSSITFAFNSKEDAHSNLIEQINKMNALEVKFNLKDTEYPNLELQGSLKAQKGNKYYINLGQRILVSNGKSVWNYNPRDKTVMLNKFNANNKDLSFEDIFFTLIKSSKPIAFYKSNKSNGKSLNYLELDVNQDLKNKFKFTNLKVGLDNSNNIKSIEMINGKNVKTWDISSLNSKASFKDSEFEFETPKDVELIDLR